MKISTKSRYGLRAMLDLAIHYNDGPIFMREISKRQGITFKYLGQIFGILKSAGLIGSIRGKEGGYNLSRSPQKIKVSDIVFALEGQLNLVECIKDPAECERIGNCVTKDVWKDLQQAMFSVLDSITLQDLVKKKLEKEKVSMFHI